MGATPRQTPVGFAEVQSAQRGNTFAFGYAEKDKSNYG